MCYSYSCTHFSLSLARVLCVLLKFGTTFTCSNAHIRWTEYFYYEQRVHFPLTRKNVSKVNTNIFENQLQWSVFINKQSQSQSCFFFPLYFRFYPMVPVKMKLGVVKHTFLFFRVSSSLPVNSFPLFCVSPVSTFLFIPRPIIHRNF